MKRVRINKNLEKSAVAGSTPITDSNNELNYVLPGALGQQLEINASGVPEYKSTLTTLKTVNRAFSKVGSGQATNNDAVSLGDDIYHTGKVLVGISTDDGTGSKIQTNGNISNIVAGGKIVNGNPAGGNNQVISQSNGGKVGVLANNNNWLGANGDLYLSANIDFDTFASPFTSIKIVNASKNVLIKKLTDSGLGDLQVPVISLGSNVWHYSEDGQQRFTFTANANTHFRVPTNFSFIIRHDTKDTYFFSKPSFYIKEDSSSDISFNPDTLTLGTTVRSFAFRKEANNQNFRFFDFNGTTGTDWWNVFTQTNKIVLANSLWLNHSGNAALGTSNPHTLAILELNSTEKGLLIPRMTTTQRDAITSPPEGLEIYNLTTHTKDYWNGSVWKTILTN